MNNCRFEALSLQISDWRFVKLYRWFCLETITSVLNLFQFLSCCCSLVAGGFCMNTGSLLLCNSPPRSLLQILWILLEYSLAHENLVPCLWYAREARNSLVLSSLWDSWWPSMKAKQNSLRNRWKSDFGEVTSLSGLNWVSGDLSGFPLLFYWMTSSN